MRLRPALLALTALLTFAGCGSDNSPDAGAAPGSGTRSVDLGNGVTLDVVRLPNGLWAGKTEITQRQYEAVTGENPSRFKGPDNPVETVSWEDCVLFLEKLNALPGVKESGLVFRLPSQSEWLDACRAGAGGDYDFYCKTADGTEISARTLDRVAWFGRNAQGKPHPVGQKEPNAFGLFDTLGNVFEMVEGGGGSGLSKFGGDWENDSSGCCADYGHSDLELDCGDAYTGFRVFADSGERKPLSDRDRNAESFRDSLL